MALLVAKPAAATEIEFPSAELQALTSLHKAGVWLDNFQPLAPQIMEILRMDHEDPLELLEEIITSENWQLWRIFQGTPGMAVPLASAQMYIFYSGVSGKRGALKFGERGLKTPTVRQGDVGDAAIQEEDLQRQGAGLGSADFREPYVPPLESSPFRGKLVVDNRIGGGVADAYKPSDGGFSFLGFLMEGDGPLSGRPWTWENFIPRLLTISAYVVGLLLSIEFLRMIFAMGVRGLGRRRGR